MILFSWLAVPVLAFMGGAVLLAAFRLRQRCRVPVVMLAVAAGCYLLAAVIVGVVVYAVGIRGVVFSLVLVSAIAAVCVETLRYLKLCAGRHH